LLAKLLREPLLHFVLIGAALFLLYDLTNDDVSDDVQSIVITEADIDRLIALWEMKWKRLPSEKELDGLIESQVREEVLYREALAMGLDENDTIVRRRMAQKVEFISDNLAEQIEPTETQLTAYLDANPEKFEIPALVSFTHVYFNLDKRSATIGNDADRTLAELRDGDDSRIENKGDPFMLGNMHEALSRDGVTRLFGEDFAEQVFSLPVGEWQGPLTSGYGLHLVRIDSLTEPTRLSLETVRDKVRQEWSAEERRRLNQSFYEQLRSRYKITFESDADGRELATTN